MRIGALHRPFSLLALSVGVCGLRGLSGWFFAWRALSPALLIACALAQGGLLLWTLACAVRGPHLEPSARRWLWALVVTLVGWGVPLPSRAEVWFWRDRTAYEASVSALLQDGEQRQRTLPRRLGTGQHIGDGSVEFILDGDFYMPMVYRRDDHPERLHDTCAEGGAVVRRLAPRWYLCRRDSN